MYEETDDLTETVLAGSPADRPWEGCVNQTVYRVPRGIPVRLPRFLAEHIRRTDEERERAEDTAERFAKAAMRL